MHASALNEMDMYDSYEEEIGMNDDNLFLAVHSKRGSQR